MLRENAITVALARAASVPFRLLARRPFRPPQKALILKPCCLSQVMLATPLLATLGETYPGAQFDWAVSEYARPAVATNVRVSELVDTGRVGLPGSTWHDVRELAQRLRAQQYDTCFIPSRSSLFALVAWMAGIPHRIGIGSRGRGFAHTLAVNPPPGVRHTAVIYLSLAHALGVEGPAQMEFYPPDRDRAAMTQLLVDEADWLGDVPLVLLHPGGGRNPVETSADKRWPVERFVLLGSFLARTRQACVLLVGDEDDRPLTQTIDGMMPGSVVDLAGRITLTELGALCEMADLYVGNDTGPTHVAAAVGCPTLAIFGPTDPARSGPYATKGRVLSLWREYDGAFSWKEGVTVQEAIQAAGDLLDGYGETDGSY